MSDEGALSRRAAPAVPAASRPAAGTLRGFILLFATAALWGANWPMNKIVVGHLPAMTARSLAGAAAGLLAFALARARRERLRPPPGRWGRLLVSTFLNFTAWMGLTMLALVWLSAGEAAVIAYTLPIWASLLAWPILGERPRPRAVAGMAIGLSGVVVLAAGGGVQASWAKLPGVALVLAASMLFALGTVLTKRAPPGLPPVAGVAWQVSLGTLPLAAAAAAFERPDWAGMTGAAWGALAYNALGGLFVSYITWFAALRRLRASTAAIGALLVPVVGVLSSAALLGEPLGPRQLLALGLTLSGVALAARG